MSGLCNHAVELTGLAGDPASPVHRRDPRAKLLAFGGLTLVAVTTPVSAWPVWFACAGVLIVLGVAARVPLGTVWRRGRLVLPPVLLVGAFVPFVRGGDTVDVGPFALSIAGLETFAGVAAKATIGVVSVVLLGATTAFPDVLAALERLRVPRLLVLIAAFAHRYVFVIVEEVARMRAALAARAYRPRRVHHAGALGGVATALFLRTYARGERVYLAMLSRGYAGTMRRLDPLRFARGDVAFVALVAVVLVPLRVGLGLA